MNFGCIDNQLESFKPRTVILFFQVSAFTKQIWTIASVLDSILFFLMETSSAAWQLSTQMMSLQRENHLS